MTISQIAILGPGLLGGSLALSAQKKEFSVSLWGRNPQQVETASQLGLQATTDLEVALRGADLVVLAVPVGAMDCLISMVKPLLSGHSLVTDVGSVKVLPHTIADHHRIPFIGSHPMAGSEKTGLAAARPDLFEQAACILTNDQNRPDDEHFALRDFWWKMGCQVYEMTAADHDRAVARISHLPHAMAVITAASSLRDPSVSSLAAGGFRDTTRVASGDPAMWAEIMIENRQALQECLQDAQNEMRSVLEYLEKGDQEGLEKFLAEVKTRKDNSFIKS